MRFFGMKFEKWVQWGQVVLRNGHGRWPTIAQAGLAVLAGRVVAGRAWKGRIRGCMRCPFYDEVDRTCGGCGCWVPAKALGVDQRCWAERLGEGKWASESQ